MTEIALSVDYRAFVEMLKERVRTAQIRASLSVNRDLVFLYWSIGKDILTRQEKLGWGAKVVDQLARDLRSSFPDMKGLSARNLKYMRSFAEAWSEEEFVQQAAAQIPWFHNVVILQKLKEPDARRFYVEHTRINGWSRAILEFQIEQRRHLCQGRAPSNFERTLPPPQSDLAQQITKDPYCFDFLTLADDAHERELERGLVEHIRDFLVELGVGFAFMGTQVHLGIVTRTPTTRAVPQASSPIAPGKG
jgi:predicted nuclease of restriction endonuclease-like (RecB) superfamily